MSINHFFFTSFTNNIISGSDGLAIQKRYRTLSTIYINLFAMFACGVWKLFGWFIVPLPGDPVLIVILPLFLLCLLVLKMGHNNAAAIILLITLHIGILICGLICNISIGALFVISYLPGTSFLVTSSPKATHPELCTLFSAELYPHIQDQPII